jgi:hypothetical protein
MATRKPLFHELRKVPVNRVKRHAAHRDAVAARILRAGSQGEIQGACRDERVLVEHLVEVAHAEEHDRVAVLPLRVEVLTHGRCGGLHFRDCGIYEFTNCRIRMVECRIADRGIYESMPQFNS